MSHQEKIKSPNFSIINNFIFVKNTNVERSKTSGLTVDGNSNFIAFFQRLKLLKNAPAGERITLEQHVIDWLREATKYNFIFFHLLKQNKVHRFGHIESCVLT